MTIGCAQGADGQGFCGGKTAGVYAVVKVVQINPNHTNAKNALKELRGW